MRRRARGFTLIEAALVLSLTGVLLAAFLPTFLRQVRTSKLAEATEQLSALHHHAAAYYVRDHLVAGQYARHCLPGSVGPFPATPSAQPVNVDFTTDTSGAPVWAALGQAAAVPLRYAYEVAVAEPGCRERTVGVTAIRFRAHGDLDGDGETSLVERAATPTPDREALIPIGPLCIIARTE